MQLQILQSNPHTVAQQKHAERLIVEFSLENFSKVSVFYKKKLHMYLYLYILEIYTLNMYHPYSQFPITYIIMYNWVCSIDR